jgi:hypothetical protein
MLVMLLLWILHQTLPKSRRCWMFCSGGGTSRDLPWRFRQVARMSIRPPKPVDHRAATNQTSDDELFGSPDGSSSSDRDSDATTVVPRV